MVGDEHVMMVGIAVEKNLHAYITNMVPSINVVYSRSRMRDDIVVIVARRRKSV